MASRLAKSLVGAARLRPSLPAIRTTALASSRLASSNTNSTPSSTTNSNLPAEDPKSKAQSVLDALPGNSLISKTAILSSAAGVSIFAISNEYYIVNEESVVAFCLLSIWFGVFHYFGPAYAEWARTQNDKMRGILNAARADHVQAVKDRIDDVKQVSGVIDVTKSLFAVSKETAKLEAEAYELTQRTAIAAEAKAVLDSWVRYEGKVKQRQQGELAESIIAKAKKELENPKVLQQILQQSVADVERIVASKAQ